MRKGENELRNQINDFIKKAKTDGTYDKIDVITSYHPIGATFFSTSSVKFSHSYNFV